MKFIYVSIFLLSMAVLCFEIFLIRFLEITEGVEVTSLVISLCLLGFSYSGVFHYLAQKFIDRISHAIFISYNCYLFSVSVILCVWVQQSIVVDTGEILWDYSLLRYLVFDFTVLSLPFFFASNAIVSILSEQKNTVSKVYAYDLVGAGCGAVLACALMEIFDIKNCLFIVCGLALLAAEASRKYYKKPFSYLLSLSTLIILTICFGLFRLEMSQYKPLSKFLFIPGSKIISQTSSPESHLTVIKNDLVPLRHAPGLNLFYNGQFPKQKGVFIDGDSFFTYEEDLNLSSKKTFDFSKQTLSYLPYYIRQNKKCDILQLGLRSSSRLQMANEKNCTSLVVIEPQRSLIELFKEHNKKIQLSSKKSNLIIKNKSVRSFLRQTNNKYDLIDISRLSHSSNYIGSQHQENYTIEAIKDYKKHLKEDGMVVISFWRDTHLKASIKMILSLEASGFKKDQLLIFESLQTTLILAKNKPFRKKELSKIDTFIDQTSFDYLYSYDKKIDKLSFGKNPHKNFAEVFKKYFYDVNPAKDDKPFFSHTSKNFLSNLFKIKNFQDVRPFLDKSYVLLFVTIGLAFLLCFFLVILPLAVSSFSQKESFKLSAYFCFYYFFIGVGFMMIEYSLIHQLKLFLDFKVYSLALVLCIFLIFSGLGSLSIKKLLSLFPHKKHDLYYLPHLFIVAIGFLLAFISRYYALEILFLPMFFRILLYIVILAPLAFFLGMPFVSGLITGKNINDTTISWAWAFNGCGSVLGVLITRLSNIQLGFFYTILSGLFLYFLSFLLLRKINKN